MIRVIPLAFSQRERIVNVVFSLRATWMPFLNSMKPWLAASVLRIPQNVPLEELERALALQPVLDPIGPDDHQRANGVLGCPDLGASRGDWDSSPD
jgi:hypothetical protein